jgi:CheY-like chemotaxis protein
LLEGRGYRALAAESGADALALADRHEGPIDLLLTDLVMPGLSGRNLATAVGTRRPGTRVLFMSGYSSDLLSREGLRKSGVHFLQKPFTEAALARSVREALDSPAPDPSAVGPDI